MEPSQLGVVAILEKMMQAAAITDDCALSDLTALYRDSLLRRLAIHPALERLREYDSWKSTDFYHILRVYLQCERDRVLTAQRLFVHKNTLVYRC